MFGGVEQPRGAVQRTGDWLAGIRAEEHKRPDRFLQDPFAALLAGPEGIAMAETFRRLGLPVEIAIIRGRLGDEALRRAVAQGISQAVNLGAGSDTRAWRLRLPTDFRYIEVDLPHLLAAKATTLERAAGSPDCIWQCADADLRRSWRGAVTECGLRQDRPTLWIIEGVLPYLPEDVYAQLVREIGELSASGSMVVADAVDRDFLTHSGHRELLDWMRSLGIEVHALDDPPTELSHAGWSTDAFGGTDIAAGFHPLLPGGLPPRLAVPQVGYVYLWATR
ncbi:SAM-dependent methyltransferase [Streptomyces sp. FIT100]|uniref:class I SAM-dependent methyltransferase n=1 Tax=Streptomyces sp. FIT100 TaxID=2837956 RepID=UPI0021C8AD21|nr:SAM-dependent methyltransferase [Streptomyces sp. FIT100]UUN28873.1 SAM-dependent methyltransferase [Streptomyces sp. FIT100]